MAPQKMLYVKTEDLPIFEKATQITGESLSNTVVQALEQFVKSNQKEMFNIQKLHVGPALDIKFDNGNIERYFREAFDKINKELDPDSEEYRLLYDEAFQDSFGYACRFFKSEIITFQGNKIFNYEHKNERPDQLFGEQMDKELSDERLMLCAPITGVPLIDLSPSFFDMAIRNVDIDNSILQNDGDWLIPNSVSYNLYKTAKGKFLLYITPNLEHITEVRLDGPFAFPYLSDYVILKDLKPTLKEVKGRSTGSIFVLPPRFMSKAISSLTNQPTHKTLDI